MGDSFHTPTPEGLSALNVPADGPIENSIEELCRRAGELEAMMAIKSCAVANLVHELRTPLVAIRGYAKMLLEERPGPLNSTQRDYLTIVAENTNRLVGLVNNVTRFMNTEQLQLGYFDLREVWRDSVERIRAAAGNKSIKIREDLAETPVMLMADRSRLAQVFDDLLANAVRFSGIGGEIHGEILRGDSSEVTVRISDSGPGIPPGLMDKIFDRYFQAEAWVSGAGDPVVRLPVVHDIVRLHGGRISVASNAGEGCTFVVELPAVQLSGNQEGAAGHDQASSSSSGR